MLLIVDKGKALYTAYWNGTVWDGPALVPGAVGLLQDLAAAAVAYESNSSRALLVYGDNTKNVRYRTQNVGTNTWSTHATDTIFAADFLNNKARRVILRADPNSDNVVLGVVD